MLIWTKKLEEIYFSNLKKYRLAGKGLSEGVEVNAIGLLYVIWD